MESIIERLEATISMSVSGLEPSAISGWLHGKLKLSPKQQGLYFPFAGIFNIIIDSIKKCSVLGDVGRIFML